MATRVLKRRLPIALIFEAVLLFGPARAFTQDNFFDSNGVAIRFVDQGQGAPILLLHGFTGSLDSWVARGILPALAKDHRVIAFDLRGHGKSGKPHEPNRYGREMALDAVRLLDYLGIRRAHIVGYSLGGMLASQLLTLHPDRFVTATLVAGGGRLVWSADEARNAEQEAEEFERDCASRTMAYRLAPPDQPKPSDENIRAQSEACFKNPDQDRFALAAIIRSRADQVIDKGRAAAVTVPTLGIAGSLDPAKATLDALHKLRPDIRVISVDGAVHAGDRGILARPELVTALQEFIDAHR